MSAQFPNHTCQRSGTGRKERPGLLSPHPAGGETARPGTGSGRQRPAGIRGPQGRRLTPRPTATAGLREGPKPHRGATAEEKQRRRPRSAVARRQLTKEPTPNTGPRETAPSPARRTPTATVNTSLPASSSSSSSLPLARSSRRVIDSDWLFPTSVRSLLHSQPGLSREAVRSGVRVAAGCCGRCRVSLGNGAPLRLRVARRGSQQGSQQGSCCCGRDGSGRPGSCRCQAPCETYSCITWCLVFGVPAG